MSDRVTAEQAIEWLTAEIEGMKKIRNATARDGRFREWRQSSLTVLQRIWPDQPGKWARFRRIPFTSPTAHDDQQAARAAYERGYSEIRRLLKVWVAEIKTRGLGGAEGAPEMEEAPKSHKEAAKKEGRLKDMLGLGHLELGNASESGSSKAGAKGGKGHDGSSNDLGRSISDALADAQKEGSSGGSGRGNKPSHARHSTAKGNGQQFATLADELDKFGVPNESRNQITSCLVQVSMRMDSGSLTWQLLQDSVGLLMQYPALARRALPLLLPYLDQAA